MKTLFDAGQRALSHAWIVDYQVANQCDFTEATEAGIAALRTMAEVLSRPMPLDNIHAAGQITELAEHIGRFLKTSDYIKGVDTNGPVDWLKQETPSFFEMNPQDPTVQFVNHWLGQFLEGLELDPFYSPALVNYALNSALHNNPDLGDPDVHSAVPGVPSLIWVLKNAATLFDGDHAAAHEEGKRILAMEDVKDEGREVDWNTIAPAPVSGVASDTLAGASAAVVLANAEVFSEDEPAVTLGDHTGDTPATDREVAESPAEQPNSDSGDWNE